MSAAAPLGPLPITDFDGEAFFPLADLLAVAVGRLEVGGLFYETDGTPPTCSL